MPFGSSGARKREAAQITGTGRSGKKRKRTKFPIRFLLFNFFFLDLLFEWNLCWCIFDLVDYRANRSRSLILLLHFCFLLWLEFISELNADFTCIVEILWFLFGSIGMRGCCCYFACICSILLQIEWFLLSFRFSFWKSVDPRVFMASSYILIFFFFGFKSMYLKFLV